MSRPMIGLSSRSPLWPPAHPPPPWPGVCYKHLKQYRPAREALLRSLQLHQHERTYEQLGQVALLQNDVQDAITTYQQATE